MRRENSIVSQSQKKKHNMRMKAEDFEKKKKKERRFCKGSQAQYKIKSFRLFHSPNLATKASLIKEQLSMRILQNLKQSKDPNNNTGIKQGSLFVRKNMAGLMARFL